MKKKMLLLSIGDHPKKPRKYRKVEIVQNNTTEVRITCGKTVSRFPITTLPPQESGFIKVGKYDMY